MVNATSRGYHLDHIGVYGVKVASLAGVSRLNAYIIAKSLTEIPS